MNLDLYQPDPAGLEQRRQLAATLRAVGGGGLQTASVRIIGEINRSTIERVASALAVAPHADELEIYVDSTGGIAAVGWDLLAMISSHPAARKTATCLRVHSAALLPFLAADRRIALPGATFLLHQLAQAPVTTARWTRAEHLETAAHLAWLDDQFAATVATITGANADVVADAMTNEHMSSVKWCIENNIVHYMGNSRG